MAAFESGAVAGVSLSAPRIDTHLSHVFLTRERAYKLKRAVRLPFVDFSTIERRRAACEAELAVNRRMGSRLYIGVLPVIADGAGAFRLGGAGEPIDWVVEMHRFDQSLQFDELARANRLTAPLIEASADRIAQAHAALAPQRDDALAPDYPALIDTLFETDVHGRTRHGLARPGGELFRALRDEHRRLAALLEQRRLGGQVRRCHGDLHLRNLCIFDGELTMFDALEFDDRLATIDVLYDLAFLLMDLRFRGLDLLANLAMNRYWDRASQPPAALATLPFFMALRACVRMAVASEAGDAGEADRYQVLAGELLRRPTPRLVAIGGLSGVGKSVIARQVAARLPGPAGARLLRTDVLRKQRDSEHPPEMFTAGAADYTPGARAKVYAAMFAQAAEAIAAGSAVILDATFQNDAARSLLSRHDQGAIGIWLDAPLGFACGGSQPAAAMPRTPVSMWPWRSNYRPSSVADGIGSMPTARSRSWPNASCSVWHDPRRAYRAGLGSVCQALTVRNRRASRPMPSTGRSRRQRLACASSCRAQNSSL
ncbi:MAG: AAA family ATPase [Burkholderiaceae bacterium]